MWATFLTLHQEITFYTTHWQNGKCLSPSELVFSGLYLHCCSLHFVFIDDPLLPLLVSYNTTSNTGSGPASCKNMVSFHICKLHLQISCFQIGTKTWMHPLCVWIQFDKLQHSNATEIYVVTYEWVMNLYTSIKQSQRKMYIWCCHLTWTIHVLYWILKHL